ncbi:DegT/DnrJ/EryC1/StrS family aminotransferase [Fuscovulum ytuae]|uniref:DegT/DnrJ/EryC1/StrS family aminotransferase n=1 Tax=Fuscovulum ytuae TaxID=3042299 RepID=A0ABY8Q3I3_9RHOB|nr:DegT/DnrJ/EryC1/StrS family aminotransferase [Fuscovulum sp. YMD61]WGV15404.1 DegT/DnrJ/EryC1/StrS family aminotransferase [Fuscovulum sp. YMD61]
METVTANTTIREAMRVLDRSQTKLCVATDTSGKVIRTLTDGDVRRALLGGATLDSHIGNLPGKEPITFPEGTPREPLLQAMRSHSINAVVIVDKAGAPVDVIARTTLENLILLSPPHMGTAEVVFIQQAFDENWVAPAGPHLARFEEGLKAVSGRQHALALSSGSAGLHLALRVLGIGAGERVYVSDLTFIASLQPILYEGAIPVLIDAEPEGWNMSPVALGRKLEIDAVQGQLPSAIIVVHLYGQSADMDSIVALADRYGVPIIEDAAESLGATYRNRPSGAHGLLSVFSFNGNKIITTSGGGALVSDRGDLVEKARNLSQQGRDTAEHYQHSQIAYNYRMSNILAGIGIAQLGHLPDRVARRRAVFARYQDGFRDIPGIRFQGDLAGGHGTRWLTVIDLDPDRIARHPYQFMRRLRAHGIETRPAWKPMHMQPLCHGMEFVPHDPVMAVSPGLFLRSLCLPSGSSLSVVDQDRVIEAVRQIVSEE